MFNINYFKNKFNEGLTTKLESSGGGLKVSINGGLKDIEQMDIVTVLEESWSSISTLPYQFCGSAVVLNNEIHILGSTSYSTKHYKYNTSTNTWSSVSILPYDFYYGSDILLDNEIHILGGYDGNTTAHYKYNTSTNTWSSVSTIPYGFYQGSAIVLNNEIHILGSSASTTNHYKIIGEWKLE